MVEPIFTPLEVGRVVLPNRIAFMAHRTNLAERGTMGERLMAYYERRAEGGAGLVVIGEWSVHSPDSPWEGLMSLPGAGAVQVFKRFMERMHRHGSMVFSRINHHGFQGSGAVTRLPVLGPSAVSDIAFGETAKVMEDEDIRDVISAFSRAATKVREAGFDGIELDMGPESLLRQFLSPISNHRGDPYGGSLENRMHFPLEVIQGIRHAIGEDFTVGIRLCADEQFWGGITADESVPMARAFQETGGVDFFHVAVGTYYNLHLQMPSMHVPLGFVRETVRLIKEAADIPVFGAPHIGFPDMASEMVANKEADAVGLVRPLICDPDAPAKAAQGRLDEIRPCLRDNQGCIGRVNRSRRLSCTQNPDVGYEYRGGGLGTATHREKKRVAVIGGGPAGMEAAIAARENGHEVTLYEKSGSLGGQVNLILRQPGRGAMEGVLSYRERALKRLGVEVHTGVEVLPDGFVQEAPDAVIVATGSGPHEKPLPGDYGPPWVQSVRDVLEGRYPIGERVLFVDEDGGHHGTATVEYLLDQGKQVTMVTSLGFIGMDLAVLGDLYLTRQRLLQKGAVFIQEVAVDEIQEGKAFGHQVYTHEPVIFDSFDTVVQNLGRRADDRLYLTLKGRVKECYRVGDCVAPRDIMTAIYEGRRAGEKL